MTAKTRRALLYIFMSLFILTMFTASLTFGRYSAEQSSDSHYSGDFEYVLSDAIVVNSIDEFFDAINNGYSNIQIGDEVDNPLIITGDTGNVWADLTIDLNGHELQRNDCDPLLNVSEGFRLTIIDSKGGGSLYNPVGSVLRSSGGTITVTDGIMESGPRNGNRVDENSIVESGITNQTELDEYANTSNGFDSATGGAFRGTGTVTYYTNNNGSSYIKDSATMPIIIPTQITRQWTTDGQTITQNALNGNMYLEEGYTPEGTNYFAPDTYLYYTIEGTGVSNEGIAASTTSADFYYTYYVNSSNYDYVSAPQDDALLVTVYGYNGVKDGSRDSAAIEATGGEVLVRGGTYYSYFGKENTYCINANGGYMSVDSSSAISFYAYGNGVCVQCNYSTDNLQTRVGDTDLRITNGNFYSELGDTISVTNGVMEIGTATFTKDASATGNNVSEGDNNSVIDISSGTLTISNSAQLNILGSGVTGISARSGAKIETNNTTIEFNNNQQNGYTYNFGISSEGGDISCSGTTKLYITGSNSTGILSSGGEITGGTINIEGEFNCNVKMLSDSGEGSSELSSTVIYTNGGTVNLNTTTDNVVNTDGSVDYGTEIESDGLGFVVYSGGLNILGTGTAHIETTRGTAVYLNGGTLNVDSNSTLDVVSEIDGSCTWALGSTDGPQNLNRYNGVYIRGGSLDSQGTLNVTHTGVQNDDLGVGNNAGLMYSTFDVNGQTYRVVGGDLTNGLSGNYTTNSACLDSYSDFVIKSYAVRIEGEDQISVNIRAGKIENSVGGGVYVSTGNNDQSQINLGDQNLSPEADPTLTITASGTTYYGGYYIRNANRNWWWEDWTITYDQVDYVPVRNGGSNWYFYVPKTGGHAVQIVGGRVNIYNGKYSAAQGNGILVEGGNVIIEDGEFTGNDSASDAVRAGAGASYAFKLYGGEVAVNGGTFGLADVELNSGNYTSYARGNGVFAMGTSSTQKATVYMNAGTINVAGTTGFSVWNYADVTFGKDDDRQTYPTINAESSAIAVEDKINDNLADSNSSITIHYGKFTAYNSGSGKNGIWYGEGTTDLEINGGEFEGGTSGLRIDSYVSGNIRISDGTFTGDSGGISKGVPDTILYSGLRSGNVAVYGTYNGEREEVTNNRLNQYSSWGWIDRTYTVVEY